VTHTGLSGRTLKAASSNRLLHSDRKAHAPMSETETVIVLGDVQAKLVDEVQRICAPMFMLFDFQEFNQAIYEDIVRRFEKGEAS
jgi:hypothetical protein